jgi:hypothetical protein
MPQPLITDTRLRPRPDLSHMRFMEISVYHVRPGKDWEEVMKMVKAAYEKAVPDADAAPRRQEQLRGSKYVLIEEIIAELS